VNNDAFVVAQCHSGVENSKFHLEQRIKGDFSVVAAVLKLIRIKSIIRQKTSYDIDVSESYYRVRA
jgi:hypothetical protein